MPDRLLKTAPEAQQPFTVFHHLAADAASFTQHLVPPQPYPNLRYLLSAGIFAKTRGALVHTDTLHKSISERAFTAAQKHIILATTTLTSAKHPRAGICSGRSKVQPYLHKPILWCTSHQLDTFGLIEASRLRRWRITGTSEALTSLFVPNPRLRCLFRLLESSLYLFRSMRTSSPGYLSSFGTAN
jgi:hypothetical protein